jgi:hypothetical protein
MHFTHNLDLNTLNEKYSCNSLCSEKLENCEIKEHVKVPTAHIHTLFFKHNNAARMHRRLKNLSFEGRLKSNLHPFIVTSNGRKTIENTEDESKADLTESMIETQWLQLF